MVHLAYIRKGTVLKLLQKQTTTTNFSAERISIGSDFEGVIDEVEIYTRGLTEAEVRELAGLYVLDFSGNGNHGVLIDGDETVSVSGSPQAKVLDALDLDGKAYADFYPAIGNLNSMTHGSISAWFASNGRRGGNGAWEDMTIFSASDKDDNGTRLSLYMRDTGQIRYLVQNGGNTVLDMYTQNVFRDPNVGEADEWHHVAVTMDKNGTSALHVDGVEQSVIYNGNSKGTRGFFTDVENIDSITIGAHFGADSTKRAFFEGKLDEIYIFDRVLVTEEILYMVDEGTSVVVYEASIKPHVDALGTFKLID